MKTPQEINEIYKTLFKKYYSEFLKEKSKKIPENCIFNIRVFLDSRKTLDGIPNLAYNRIGSVLVRYNYIDFSNESSIQLGIDGHTYLIPRSEIHSKVDELEQFGGYILLSSQYVTDNLPYIQIPTIGVCKVALKTEVRICEDACDAIKCPAYISMYNQSNLRQEFWKHANVVHPDLIVLDDITTGVANPSFWQRIKELFSFKKIGPAHEDSK